MKRRRAQSVGPRRAGVFFAHCRGGPAGRILLLTVLHLQGSASHRLGMVANVMLRRAFNSVAIYRNGNDFAGVGGPVRSDRGEQHNQHGKKQAASETLQYSINNLNDTHR